MARTDACRSYMLSTLRWDKDVVCFFFFSLFWMERPAKHRLRPEVHAGEERRLRAKDDEEKRHVRVNQWRKPRKVPVGY